MDVDDRAIQVKLLDCRVVWVNNQVYKWMSTEDCVCGRDGWMVTGTYQ